VSHGGKRPGAGRKPGSATEKTREIAEQASAYAKDAAPYCHARLGAINHGEKVVREVTTTMTDDELADVIRRCKPRPG
jgi:hypothetical protein